MTGWRCAAIVGNAAAIEQFWRLKSNIDRATSSGPARRRGGAAPDVDATWRDERRLSATPRPRLRRAGPGRGQRHPAKGTIYVVAPVPRAFANAAEYCEHVLEQRRW